VRRTVLGCMERSPRLLVVAALAVTIGLWASAFVAIRGLLPALGPGGVASARLSLAAVAFGVIALLAGVRRPTRAELPGLAVLGATGYAGYQLLLNAGERTVPAGTAALLLSITPVVAAVLAGPLLGERLGRRGWAGLAVALAGAAVVALSRRQGGGVGGALLVAAAAVVYATWIVLQKRALRTMSPIQVTAWGTWFGALIALPFGHGLPHALGDLSSSELWELAGLGLVVSTVPFLLWSWVLQRMDASLAAPALLTIGPTGVLLGWLLLGEQPAPLALLGGAITVMGVVIVQGAGSRTPTRLTAPAAAVPRGANLLLTPKGLGHIP
jgi:drug/metabolite transporter (DMT)-like permease